jgi:hypothetical protein
VRKRLTDIAALPIIYSPAVFGAFMGAEMKKWAEVVRRAGVRAE